MPIDILAWAVGAYTGLVVDIASNLRRLRDRIDSIARSSGRSPELIDLLAVSKTFPADAVEQAYRVGQTSFGENRVQEARLKIPAIGREQIQWHLIGNLQLNKVRRAVALFDVIQTLDREEVVLKVARCAQELGKKIAVYIQVNVGAEDQKHGVEPGAVEELVTLVDYQPSLDLLGLMAIPPHQKDPEGSRPYFRRLADLMTQVNGGRAKPLSRLSMGMSHDYSVAIEEGATLLRIGSAIFGARAPVA